MNKSSLPALARLIYADWDEAPEAMAFEDSWKGILEGSATLLEALRADHDRARADPASLPDAYWLQALALFVRLPAIVNVVLNWKICLEQGLPLHPTTYFEVDEDSRGRVSHPEADCRAAAAAFVDSIALARALVRLDPAAPGLATALLEAVDPIVHGFVFTSKPDKYTWRACDPDRILGLAARVETGMPGAGLLVGAAHGSLIPGFVLAETLGWELWFLRFSMFKRNDREPIVSDSDRRFLTAWRDRPVLLFDEDVAKGRTMEIFSRTLAPLFSAARTASVIRHGLSGFRPDFCGLEWYDR
jgi:hypothetical protein